MGRVRRHLRRRRALFDPPGMGDEFWTERKRIAEFRMGIIDAAPREWRDLVNEFGPDDVAEMAGRGYGVVQARHILQRAMDRLHRFDVKATYSLANLGVRYAGKAGALAPQRSSSPLNISTARQDRLPD